ncbi:MAG: UbiD family decarboxylase [Phycisphaeraceae bacterium]|nr:UbiD family decarboxylase [Phycisphaeraceae bacterium]
MYENTQDFIRALDLAGELRRVKGSVSPVLEISEIADRVSKSPAPHGPTASARASDPRFCTGGGHALLFENVQGSDIPVLINGWGSYRRVEMALGCNDAGPGVAQGHTLGGFEGLAEKIERLVKPEPPPTLLAKLQKIPELIEIAKIPPKRVRSGICQDVVHTDKQVDLTRLPIIKCWPRDGDFASLGYPVGVNDAAISENGLGSGTDWDQSFRGRYITLGSVHTIHADDIGKDAPPSRNIGMYRAQLFGKRYLAMHWHMHHDGARHWRSWKAKGERMPVAIALGGESILPYAATAPMPPGISEFLLAGFLNRGPIPIVNCKTVPLSVPANAEIVIEGYVSSEAGLIGFDPNEIAKQAPRGTESEAEFWARQLGPGAIFEGPFGDHTGFYSLPDRYPLMEVTAITHRRDPVYPTTIVGLPPQEDYYLGKATERIFLPLLRTIVPDIIDYDLPMFGAFHNCAFVKIKKEYPLHARRVMHAIWGAGQMSWTKTIVIVDHDVNVHDGSEVLRTVGERCVPARDCELVRGPLDILDHAAPFLGAGGKLGLDATRKTEAAEMHRALDETAQRLCEAGPIDPVTGDAARATETRVRRMPGVLDARVPDELGGWWLLVRIAKQAAGDGARTIKALGGLTSECGLPRWTLVVGGDADLANLDDALFHWMANTAPDRDRALSLCGRRVAFDATPKLPGDEANGQPVREWPPILKMSAEVDAAVDAKWAAFGFE